MLKLNSHNSWETCEIDFPTKTGDDLLSRCAALIMAQHNHEITTYDPAFHPTRMEGDASGFIQSGLRFASFHRTGNWLFPLSLGLSKEEENFRIKSAMDALGGGNFGRRFILESSSAEERMVRDKESGKEMRPEEIERRRKELEAGHWRKLEEEKAKAAAFEQAKIDAAKQKAEDDEFEKEWWEKRLKNLKATVGESEGAEREEKEMEMEWIENRLKQFADAKKSSDSKKEEVEPKGSCHF
ncbi:hypothetical protein BT69DRAFT_379976 [Atractiella rhizophila]|nr:hypothetical protein BT69DRAFT_379976 [Atractiella rhizophila]